MIFTFEYENDMSLTSFSTGMLDHEPNSDLLQFGISSDQQINDSTNVVNGDYSALTWSTIAALMTQRAISRIGIKNFPQVGACGFFIDKYTGQTTVLIPIRTDDATYSPPTLAISEVTGGISVTITPPEDITYTCYKIIMRSGYYANEYVMYDLTATLPTPAVIGDYDVYAIGYNEDTGIISSWSNVEELSITSGEDDWSPAALVVPMSLADLTDVSIVDLLNAQAIRYNSTSQKWENVTP